MKSKSGKPAGTLGVKRPFAPLAFALLELLVMTGVLLLLILVSAPALTRVEPGTRSIQCVNNTRKLIAAWQMYAQDYNDKAVIAVHGGAAQGGIGDPTWGVGWASGWLDWSSSTDNTNSALLLNPRFARLGKYVGQAAACRCPSDTYVSAPQRARGWTQRVRSYSQNIYVGAGNAESGPTDPIYKHIQKTSDFLFPNPSEAWVFTEEHPDSINDPAFFPPHSTAWVDFPSALHNGAGSFAFADGHSELHKWEGSLTSARVSQIRYNIDITAIAAPAADPDIHWLSYHSARVSSRSY